MRVERLLYGHYYNADTVLYLLNAQEEPQLLAVIVKQAYNKTICSHLNDEIDLSTRYRSTAYYGLRQELESQLQDQRWTMAELPLTFRNRIPPIPRQVESDGDLVVYLYTLQDPAIFKA